MRYHLAKVPKPLTDSTQLKLFAREAEVNENYDLAAKYYQEVYNNIEVLCIVFLIIL